MIKFSKQLLSSVAFVAVVGYACVVSAWEAGSAMATLTGGLDTIQNTAGGVVSTGNAVSSTSSSAVGTSNAVSGIGSSGGVVGTASDIGNAAGSAKSTINAGADTINKGKNLLGGDSSGSGSGSGSGSSGGSGSSSGSGSDTEHTLQITDVPKDQRPAGEDPKKNMTEAEKERARAAQATLISGSYATESARVGIGVASAVQNARSLPVAQQQYQAAVKDLNSFKGDPSSSAYQELQNAVKETQNHYQALASEELSRAQENYNKANSALQSLPEDTRFVPSEQTKAYLNAESNLQKAQEFAKDAGLPVSGASSSGSGNTAAASPGSGKPATPAAPTDQSTGSGVELSLNEAKMNESLQKYEENMQKLFDDMSGEAPATEGPEVQEPGSTRKAEEVNNDGEDKSKGDGPRDGGYWDPIQSVMVAIMPGLQKNTVDEFKNVIIEAADIGDAMGAIDQTVMNEQGDGVNANTPSSGVAYSVALLQNVPIDVSRWINTKVGSDEEETPEEVNVVNEEVNVVHSDITNSGVNPGASEKTEDEEEEEKEEEEEEEEDPYKVEILARRMELARQYANAGVQIAEGMNAISADFPARAQLLLAQLNGVKDYASAIGALSDIVREDLAETLRATALSSAELGVASSRVLLDSGFVKKKKENSSADSGADSGTQTEADSGEPASPAEDSDSSNPSGDGE